LHCWQLQQQWGIAGTRCLLILPLQLMLTAAMLEMLLLLLLLL
jgi:hypothetical protein